MFAADFDYYRAGSVAEAGQLLAQHPGAKVLAGGHSLIPLLKLRLAAPGAVIDIGRIAELRGITTAGDALRIGALTTHSELASSADVRQHAAALAEAASQIGDPAVRNRGTVGGNIAHADPASDLPTVLAALGATVDVVGPEGERSVPIADFFRGVMMTSLGERDLLTSIRIPVGNADRGTAYVKFSHPASRYAVIGVAASITPAGRGWLSTLTGQGKGDPTCGEASVAIGGLVPVPTRCAAVEGALGGQPLTPEACAAAADAVGGDLGGDLLGDIFASAEYRKAVAPVYVRQALAAAAERATANQAG